MFIADALLGNFDRHNGNWGILVNEQSKTAEIAPVYDCGSCLYPQLAAKDMEVVLNSEDEIDRRVYVFPASSIEEDGKKISYFEFISSLKNPDCTAALKRVSAWIDMEKISTIINETPTLLPIQKEFYTVMISERKAKIIDYSMEQLIKLDRQKPEQEELQGHGQQFHM
jgi:hypothetical protein